MVTSAGGLQGCASSDWSRGVGGDLSGWEDCEEFVAGVVIIPARIHSLICLMYQERGGWGEQKFSVLRVWKTAREADLTFSTQHTYTHKHTHTDSHTHAWQYMQGLWGPEESVLSVSFAWQTEPGASGRE